MKKTLALVTVGLVLLLLFLSRSSSERNEARIYASNFAIYDALKAILPKEKKVLLFIPLGQDLHSFQPNPKMVANALSSELFFYLTGSMSGWLEKFLVQEVRENFIDVGTNVVWEKSDEDDDDEHHHDHEKDPHYWLSPLNQITVATNIYNSLVSVYPELNNTMEKRFHAYINELKKLDQENRSALSSCRLRQIIVTHNAFAYLAKLYNFQIISIVGVSPQSMANPKKMQEIITVIKEKNYKTIFFESFISDTMAKTIAKETGSRIDVLNPMATVTQEDFDAQKSYKVLMKENITKIAEAMECR